MLDRERQAPMTPRLPRGDYGEIGKLSGNYGSLDLLVAACYLASYFVTGDSNCICRKSSFYATKIAISYMIILWAFFKLCITIVCTTTE
jgi:hypothetical protein